MKKFQTMGELISYMVGANAPSKLKTEAENQMQAVEEVNQGGATAYLIIAESKAEYVTFLLHNPLIAVIVHNFPRRLHTERRLEIRFGGFEITKYKYKHKRKGYIMFRAVKKDGSPVWIAL